MIKNKVEFNPDMLNESQKKYKLKRIKQLEKQLDQLKKIVY